MNGDRKILAVIDYKKLPRIEICEQAINLNIIEADVSKHLIDEIDKLNLADDEKIYATMAILKNITTDIMLTSHIITFS